MAISAKIDAISQSDGKIYVRIGKTTYEFNSRAQALEWAAIDVRDVKEFLIKILVQEWRRRNPTGSNPGQIVGVTITLDLDGTNNVVRLS